MRKFSTRSKVVAALGAGAVAVAGSGVAYAYFTSSGSGTGSAATTTSHSVTLSGITVSGFAPGLTKSVPYTFTNTAGNGTQNFGAVTISTIADADIHAAANHTCTAAMLDFTLAASTSAVGTVSDGATFTPTSATEPTITMTDTGSSQDGCQGATVDLTLHIAQGS